jgi:legumain
MNKILLISLLVVISFNMVKGERWAVLVSGSNFIWNYRHQSDVCHAYNLLLDNGFNPKKIILMIYDDIANNGDNPIKGKIFNFPDPNGPGQDVYARCQKAIDY